MMDQMQLFDRGLKSSARSDCVTLQLTSSSLVPDDVLWIFVCILDWKQWIC